ncbi:MAG: XTP/dITP diphosphatase [Ignavibacteriales bacterium]
MAGRRIVIATRNAGKVREIKEILGDLDVETLSLADFPGVDSPEETGASFEENAIIKASHAAQASGILSLADDSGLEVDALDGQPGVRSARFAGEGAGDEANNRKLLRLLEGVPANRRTARFKCCVAVCSPDGAIETVTESCEGTICFEPRGSSGFGYDPLFYVKELGMTFAETSVETKNRLSHRGKALRAVRPVIMRMLGILPPAGEDNCC